MFPGGRTWDQISLAGYALGTSPYGWFHEGFAQAQECIYFDYCHLSFGGRVAGALNDHKNTDPHDRGRPFEFALRDLNERIKVYGDRPLTRRGFRLSWGMADFIALRPYVQDDQLKNVQHLGRTASTMAGRVRAGTGGIINRDLQEGFVSEIAYWYQYHGIPLGTQAFHSPPVANMIGYFVGNRTLATSPPVWGTTTSSNSAPRISTIGSRTKDLSDTDRRELYHETRLYLSNPLFVDLDSHCATVIRSGSMNGGIERPVTVHASGNWLGETTFTSTEVKAAITKCITPFVGTFRECALDLHVDVLLWEEGTSETGFQSNNNRLLARASTVGLFHNSSVYPSFRIDNVIDEEECGRRAIAALLAGLLEKWKNRGCSISKASGTELFLFTLPFVWITVRRRAWRRLSSGGLDE